MKTRSVILVAVVALLVLSTGTLAQPGGLYTVEQRVVSGGGYRLIYLAPASCPDSSQQVSGTASGGQYRLSAAPALVPAGSGCCCTQLPLLMRNNHP